MKGRNRGVGGEPARTVSVSPGQKENRDGVARAGFLELVAVHSTLG